MLSIHSAQRSRYCRMGRKHRSNPEKAEFTSTERRLLNQIPLIEESKGQL